MVRISIIGTGATKSVVFPDGSNTEDVEKKLLRRFGAGGLERDGVGIITDTLTGDYEYHVTATSGIQEHAGGSPVHESRKSRWDGLNAVLDISKRVRVSDDGMRPLGYSYVNWKQVKAYFPTELGVVGEAVRDELPAALLTALHQYLSIASVCFGSISEGHEPQCVHFIAPIIIIVCSHFRGDVQILAEEEIEGSRVHAHGRFEFVLKRGGKRICIVEAKKDDILQAKTQSLVGCESLCDVEELSVTYGIATNYLVWCFLKNEADKVTEEMLTLSLESGHPTIESLRTIANKIISILQ